MPRTVYSKLLFAGAVTNQVGGQQLYFVGQQVTVVVRSIIVAWYPSALLQQPSPEFFIRYYNECDLVYFRPGDLAPYKLYYFERRTIIPNGNSILAFAGTDSYFVNITGYELTGVAP